MRELILYILDIVQNSITAGASEISITVEENEPQSSLLVEVKDNGKGMTTEQTQRAFDPFYTTRTTREIGLGIPLLKMQAEMTGGDLRINSALHQGSAIQARFCTNSVNMLSLGNFSEILLLLIACNPHLSFIFRRIKTSENTAENKEYVFSTISFMDRHKKEFSLSYPHLLLSLKSELALADDKFSA